MTTDSPMHEVILRITARWNIRPPDAKALYDAITDDIFYQELGHRLGTNYPVANGPLIFNELKPITWEYIVRELNRYGGQDHTLHTQLLDEYGAKGWELVTVINGVGYFKRPCGS